MGEEALAMEDSSNGITKSPDTETPPHANGGAFKTRRHHFQPAAVVLYKECLKNHAAGIGGLALDGCGEFMPTHSATNTDPTSLKCAACGCHRNFHRRELEDPSAAQFIGFRQPQVLPPPLNRSLTPSPSVSRSQSPPQPNVLLGLSTGHSGDYNYRREGLNRGKIENPDGKKRFRTKFSHTQKDKMQAFAEKLGWKMHKSHESLVEEFCNEIGVSRGVLKVWIHNNKQSIRKRDPHHLHLHHHQIQINNEEAHNHGGGENGNGNGNSRVSFETHRNECNSNTNVHGSSSSS